MTFVRSGHLFRHSLSMFLFSGIIRKSRLIWYLSCSSPGISHFSQRFLAFFFFYWKNSTEKSRAGASYAYATGALWLLGPLKGGACA